MLITATPSLIRSVTAAAYPSATMGSSTLWYTGSMAEPSGTSSRWKVHSDPYPAVSARAAKRPRLPGVAHAPATGARKRILMDPPLGGWCVGGGPGAHGTYVVSLGLARPPRPPHSHFSAKRSRRGTLSPSLDRRPPPLP